MFSKQEALKKCERENRKAITADDVLWCLMQSGPKLDDYSEAARNLKRQHRAIEAHDKLLKRQAGMELHMIYITL